jgi:hypothetical protein
MAFQREKTMETTQVFAAFITTAILVISTPLLYAGDLNPSVLRYHLGCKY